MFTGKKNESETKKTEENDKKEEVKKDRITKEQDESFCPKVKIDIGKVVEDTERRNEEAERNTLTTDSNVDDNPADDYLDF